MSENKYGVIFGKNEHGKYAAAEFGDGLTRIQSLGWEDGRAGIAIVRDGMEVPFSEFGADDAPEGLKSNALEVNQDKIIIAFDNPKSIDAMIERLKEAKVFLG